MATLEKIRNKGGIIVAIFIGFALVAFILTDLLGSGKSPFGSSNQEIAEINGNSVSIQDFQNIVAQQEKVTKLSTGRPSIDENMSHSIRERAWNQLIQDILMGEVYEELGIDIPAEEMVDLFTGNNIHPSIKQMFTNPQTGMFDRSKLLQSINMKKQNPDIRFFWDFQEGQIRKETLLSKYNELLKKGIYVTDAQAQSEAKGKAKKVDFDFVLKRFSSIADSTIQISKSEISKYYDKNIEDFKQEATRKVEYITFNISPSAEDKKIAEEKINQIKEEFSAPEVDPIQYVTLNSDENFVEKNQKLDEVPANLQDFVANGEVGAVFGPYFENNAYKVVRIAAIKQLPDSAKARHILIKVTDPVASTAKADSLKKLLDNGANFAELARENSEDPGSAINGGDLGWFQEGRMVPQFNDACFEGKKGDIVKVNSQFGIHLIHIQDKGILTKKYVLATMQKDLVYSSKTYQNIYSNATRFVAANNSSEKFLEASSQQNLIKTPAKLGINDRRVGNLESPRELVKWAFEASIGDLSPIFEFGDKFVIATLTNASEKGYKDMAQVSAQIIREVRKEKKADIFIKEFNSNKANSESLSSLAQKVKANVQSATDITFGSSSVPGAGSEPALIALATLSNKDEISAPVAGNNGVFVVKVTAIEAIEVNAEQEKKQKQQSLDYSINYKAFEAIKENADIEDNRATFY